MQQFFKLHRIEYTNTHTIINYKIHLDALLIIEFSIMESYGIQCLRYYMILHLSFIITNNR